MKCALFVAFLLMPTASAAQSVMPSFTQGTMTSTTSLEQTITESTKTQKFGSKVTGYSGENVTPSGAINSSTTTYSVTTAGEAFQLEFTERAAGLTEQIDVERTIETTSTTTSLSVFSQ